MERAWYGFRTQQGPIYRVLTEDQILRIHYAALEILESIGSRIDGEEALDLCREAGCSVTSRHVVTIPVRVVEQAMSTVPKRMVLADRNGKRTLFFQGRNAYFCPNAGCPELNDPYTGEKRSWKKQDIANAAKLVDALPNMDAVFSIGSLGEEYGTGEFVHEFDAMVRNTTKPIVFLAHDVEDLKVIYEMAAAVAGGWDNLVQNPFLLFFDEPLPPLYHKEASVRKLLYCAEKNLPCRYGPLAMSGASSPCTPAGVLAQSYAESLVGLVLTQLRRPGAPYITAAQPGIMDLQTGTLSYGAPEWGMMQAAFAEICHYFHLPVMTSNGGSDSKVVDAQAGIEATLRTLAAAFSGAHLSHGASALASGLIGSFEMVCLTDEIIGMVRRIGRGITVDDDSLALDTIREVGARGSFLETEHTLRNFKREHWRPTILDRHNFEWWESHGKQDLAQRLNERVRHILDTHIPQPLAPNVSEALDSIVAIRG